MTTQVVFTIDKKLKQEAMKKARSLGMPFSSVLNIATRAFVEGTANIEMVDARPFNAKTRRALAKAIKEIEDPKNVSPKFSSAKDAIHYLES